MHDYFCPLSKEVTMNEYLIAKHSVEPNPQAVTGCLFAAYPVCVLKWLAKNIVGLMETIALSMFIRFHEGLHKYKVISNLQSKRKRSNSLTNYNKNHGQSVSLPQSARQTPMRFGEEELYRKVVNKKSNLLKIDKILLIVSRSSLGSSDSHSSVAKSEDYTQDFVAEEDESVIGTTTIFMDSILLIFVAVRGPEITCFESLLSQRQISRSLGPLTLDCEFRAFFIFPALVDCMRRGGVLHGNESSCMKGLSSGRNSLGGTLTQQLYLSLLQPFFPRSEVDAVITVLYVKSIISTIPKILIRAVEARVSSFDILLKYENAQVSRVTTVQFEVCTSPLILAIPGPSTCSTLLFPWDWNHYMSH
uniref:CHHC U11-48K-type domain-containing protein n=1 Tax=Heterorhabditis bacteriophora TaxID=37862 RepID=A0A1I7X3M5_HETBA